MRPLAIDYRYAFASDVVVDLIGYRRHGHSEVDDPTITQPLLYKKIKERPPLWKIYAQRLGADEGAVKQRATQIQDELDAGAAKTPASSRRSRCLRTLPGLLGPLPRRHAGSPGSRSPPASRPRRLRELGEAD